ncbi:hypothetical protein EV702DRAFT_1051010 [Suillus placidus]|uniref:Uncharacterized protein n=1 Tax=Suillus placidus TaxID=48579 RepID=A0A9P6ZGU0_9AGAM|nr:hypothetical protein EV702DRAFT_1051010 [Suillus placidus]
MSRLVSLFTNAAEDYPLTPVVESYPLNNLHLAAAMHMYPPQTAAPVSLDSHLSVTSSSTKEFTMVLFDRASETTRRKRDDDDQLHNKIFLKEVDQLSRLQDDRLGLDEAQKEAHIEQDRLLSEKDALFQYEARVTREKLLAEKEAKLACFSSEYSSKIASLDVHMDMFVWGALLIYLQSQMQQANTTRSIPSPAWHHIVGKRPVATCMNIVGFSIISDTSSESDGDEEPQIGIRDNAAPLLTSLLADVPIQNSTVGMLVEALAKALQILLQTTPPRATRSKHKTHKPPVKNFTDAQRRNNKANIWELFQIAFHFMKDGEFMLHETVSLKAISSFMYGSGMGPNPLELQWDMTMTHNSKWNQKVIDILCSQYTSLLEKNQWTSRFRQSIMDDITNKFNQCCKCWRKVQPHVPSNGIHKTMQEVGDRLVDQTNE